MEDKAKFKTYEGICPVCGETMWICKSIGMKIGINAGIGNCPYCKTFLHITFDEERQKMDLERYEEYRERYCKEHEKDEHTKS